MRPVVFWGVWRRGGCCDWPQPQDRGRGEGGKGQVQEDGGRTPQKEWERGISSPEAISACSTGTASFGQVRLVLQLCQMELSGWLKKKNSTYSFACCFASHLHTIHLMSYAHNFPALASSPPQPPRSSCISFLSQHLCSHFFSPICTLLPSKW